MSRRALSLSVASLVTAVLFACSPEHIALRPELRPLIVGAGPVAAKLRVPDGVPGGLDVIVSSRGAYLVGQGEHTEIEIELDVLVENRSEKEIGEFLPRAATLLTRDRTVELPNVAPVESASTTEGHAVPVMPGERRSFELAFRLRDTEDPRDVPPCKAKLTFSYGRADYSIVVPFVEQVPARVVYAYPWSPWPLWGPPYQGYGWGWGVF